MEMPTMRSEKTFRPVVSRSRAMILALDKETIKELSSSSEIIR